MCPPLPSREQVERAGGCDHGSDIDVCDPIKLSPPFAISETGSSFLFLVGFDQGSRDGCILGFIGLYRRDEFLFLSVNAVIRRVGHIC